MSKIVTQDKLNELTGKNIDYGQGGGTVPIMTYYCPYGDKWLNNLITTGLTN